VEGQAELLEVVQALGSSGGLARGLDCRQQKRNEYANDGDYD
jgi:hypothetical protein